MPMLANLTACLLAAVLVGANDIQSGEWCDRIVSIRGVVTAVVRDEIDNDYNWLVLGTADGQIYAATGECDTPLADLRGLTDAEIELTGIVARFTSWRRFLGYQLCFGREIGSIAVLDKAPADPFSVPDFDTVNALHRRKAKGVVVAATREHFFLRTENRTLVRVIPAEGLPLPSVGSCVTVAGFVKVCQYTPLFDNSVWRVEPDPVAAARENAETINVNTLFTREGDRIYANNRLCGRIVKLSGFVESAPVPSRTEAFFLNCSGTSIKVDVSGLGASVRETPPVGTEMEITGLCYAMFSDTEGTSVFPHLDGFVLIPRAQDDIRVIRAAPWWTPGRLLGVICILIAVIGSFSVWIVALRIVSTRRGRALAREQILGARAELKVEERTRLAVELHDSISQTLTGVALQIDAAAGADGPSAKRFLTTARNMLSSCRQELNGCLWDLRSRTFEEKDMTEAVQRTLAPHVGSAKLTVRFNVPREKLSEQTAHAVLRIVRELGTNAVKHGHAKNIRIAGEFHDGTISFSVADDGCGFDTTSAPGPVQGHFGLQGVRERLNGFNGTIRCDSEPGAGAKFTVVLHTMPSETE